MSKIEVNTVEPQCGTTLTVGKCNTSVNVPGSATVTGNATAANIIASGNVVKTNAVQASDAGNIISQSGTTITLGASGDTISLAGGASQSGFGRTGTVDWQTTVKTGDFTAVNGEGYFVNTTSGEIDVTLPAGTAGAIVAVADYANTVDTNNIILKQNGSDKIEGSTDDFVINQEGVSITLVFIDSTKGWITTDTGNSSNAFVANFLTATGGTITISGNDKIHTFTGPGSFDVTKLANAPACNQLSYMVIAGGGGGGWDRAGGGGAGGFREDKSPTTPYTASPIEGAGTINATIANFPIVVGGGGGGGNNSNDPSKPGQDGSLSSFSTITSAGGGGGGAASPNTAGRNGGSGGGTSGPSTSSGTGNTPPVSPSQGFPGGTAPAPGGNNHGAGGGGATASGSPGATGSAGGAGGAGATTSINATPTARAGGGGGGGSDAGGGPKAGGAGGAGGGGAGGSHPGGLGTAATINTGGGGGGGSNGPNSSPAGNGGTGGSGIVIIRYKFQ